MAKIEEKRRDQPDVSVERIAMGDGRGIEMLSDKPARTINHLTPEEEEANRKHDEALQQAREAARDPSRGASDRRLRFGQGTKPRPHPPAATDDETSA